ncbi:MAG: hypothetical protein HRF46_09580 [Acidobacteriota bacterium]|jgi:hypothetical protein
MARHEFFPATPGPCFFRSLAWGVFLALSSVAGVVALLFGLLKTGAADAVLGALLMVGSLEGLYRWFGARRPLVVVEDDAVVWRSGLGMRRHALNDLAFSPDPFDVTVLRLQTRGGKFLRLPRDGVARAAELERLLEGRLGGGVAATPATATPVGPPVAAPASRPPEQ